MAAASNQTVRPPRPSQPPQPPQPHSGAYAPPVVAVVDDDPDIRLTVSLVLERAGFTVVAFDDGQSALDSTMEAPALILLDYMMPRLDAAGFLRARRQHPQLRNVPVVVISAYRELVEAVVSQTVGVLHKPIDLEILLECVHYHCRRTPGS